MYGPNYICYHVCLDCFGLFGTKKREHLRLVGFAAGNNLSLTLRAPPTLPARKHSSARAPGGAIGLSRDSVSGPQLPPKPGRSSTSASKSPAASGGDESSSVVDDDDDEPGGGKNAEWYEYGCV